MTILNITTLNRFPRTAPLLFLLAGSIGLALHTPLQAQGLDARETIETIVGSEVETAEETVATDKQRVVSAIEKSLENAAIIRKRFSIDNVRIVFLPDLNEGNEAAAPVRTAMEEAKGEIVSLREAIEGSAIFYHAINSHSILLNDIVAVEFGDQNDVTILVSGRKN